MSTTLTIRNLDESVKRDLRLRAARNQTSMEAEARSILAGGVRETGRGKRHDSSAAASARKKRIEAALGVWKSQMQGRSTDEIMQELRGED